MGCEQTFDVWLNDNELNNLIWIHFSEIVHCYQNMLLGILFLSIGDQINYKGKLFRIADLESIFPLSNLGQSKHNPLNPNPNR